MVYSAVSSGAIFFALFIGPLFLPLTLLGSLAYTVSAVRRALGERLYRFLTGSLLLAAAATAASGYLIVQPQNNGDCEPIHSTATSLLWPVSFAAAGLLALSGIGGLVLRRRLPGAHKGWQLVGCLCLLASALSLLALAGLSGYCDNS